VAGGFVPSFAAAAHGRKAGAGIIIGSPTGVSFKYWMGNRNAIDAAFSIISKNDLYLHADYLWHDYAALPRPEEGRLPLYYGIGAAVASSDKVGIRGVIGIEYLFADYPFDIFLELAPVLLIAPDVDLTFTGGLGARYFWGK
jgi:hypothetical protein